jgi:NADP-reducing hydrogenase subunit HndB
MPRINSVEELHQLRREVQQSLAVRDAASTRIIVGMGTCGIAAGAREVLEAIEAELKTRGIVAAVSTVGCIGMCVQEPLVEIVQGDRRVTYGKMTPDTVPTLIEQHLVRDRIVAEWVVAKGAPPS